MMTKKEIRKTVNERRKNLTEAYEAESSKKILDQLFELPEYKEASCVFIYIDYNHEVRTWGILERALADGKRVAAPRVDGKAMDFYYITSKDDLESGYFGIMEPKTDIPMAAEDACLFIMPGVAFDRGHHRVGYGGGFYDRYLERKPDMVTVAVAFECQMFDEVPFEVFDRQPSVLITEKGYTRL